MGDLDDPVVVHRPGSSRPIAVATVVTCVLLASGQLLAGPLDAASTYAVLAGLLLTGCLAWVALWQTAVRVEPHAVTLDNPVRRVTITWPAVVDVDGRFGLRLTTVSRTWSAWAAGPPPGRARARGEESEAGALVRSHWDRVRAAGHLDTGVVERAEADVAWRPYALLALAVPALGLTGAVLAAVVG